MLNGWHLPSLSTAGITPPHPWLAPPCISAILSRQGDESPGDLRPTNRADTKGTLGLSCCSTLLQASFLKTENSLVFPLDMLINPLF